MVIKSDAVIQTKANVALALIRTYTAFGGGWQIRSTEPLSDQAYVPSPQGSYIIEGDESDVATPESAKQPPTDEISNQEKAVSEAVLATEKEILRPAFE